jgi:hypothetical protein
MEPTLVEQRSEGHCERADLPRLIALAERLQGIHQDRLSPREVEAIGREMGLDPAYIRQALALVNLERARPGRVAAQEPPVKAARAREFWSLLFALGLSFAWSAVVYQDCGSPLSGIHPARLVFGTVLMPVVLAVLQGALAGRGKAAFAGGPWLMLCLSPSFWWLVMQSTSLEVVAWLAAGLYVLIGGPLAGVLGWLGSRARAYYFPPGNPSPPRP